MSSDVIWHIRDKLWPMPKHGSIRKVYACLAVTCHLHFWQNDRDFLRATVVTRGWNGYRNKSQHRKSTLEKKILPPFQQGFEPATFQSRVRCSNHWAIPAPPNLFFPVLFLLDWVGVLWPQLSNGVKTCALGLPRPLSPQCPCAAVGRSSVIVRAAAYASDSREILHCFLVGADKSYVIATSDSVVTLHSCFQPASLTPHPAPLHIRETERERLRERERERERERGRWWAHHNVLADYYYHCGGGGGGRGRGGLTNVVSK